MADYKFNGKELRAKSGSLVGKIDGKIVKDERGSPVGKIDGNKILDAHGSTIGEIKTILGLASGPEIRDEDGTRIGAMMDARKSIDGPAGVALAALWLLFVR